MRLVLATWLVGLSTFGCSGSSRIGGSSDSGTGGNSASGGATFGGAGSGGAGSGANASGGAKDAGVAQGSGGIATSSGGENGTGGASLGGAGGSRPNGGAAGTGAGAADDASAAGTGAGGAGGASAAGSSGGGQAGTSQGPCDIYASGNTPCVAAHSTVRALYEAYSGSLYQLKRESDGTTKDVPLLTRGGFADTSVQDAFCLGTSCTITIIYDQSPQKNDLPISGKTHFMPTGGLGANATDATITVGGHTVHGIYVVGEANYDTVEQPNVAYRLNKTKGVATGDQPEAMYMVLDGSRYSAPCCFDYGNAETTGNNDGNGTMEAIYWGSDTKYSKGVGNGPWVCGDLENGMYKGNVPMGQSPPPPSNTSVTGMAYVTTMLKGFSGNHFGLKAGDAQSGTLQVKWDGTRPPATGYSPKKLEGGIILGTGGDGSSGGSGTFFEGAMTSGVSSDAIDDAIQANIVAAGYGR